ncbi:MAG TPA: TetR family transcriptional regulator [Solirubrobacteraceae bacterium]|nr:TetR family transcriptional regulator [Solirubrobacteraceae bacterium]
MTQVEEDLSDRLMHEVQRELVRSVQRSWIMSALAKVVCEHGPEGASVRQIVTRAGVSRRRFYELFASSDECFRAVFEEAVRQATECAAVAYGEAGSWEDRLRSGLFALLAYLDSEPELARLSVLHTTPAGPATDRRNQILGRLAALIDTGGRSAPGALNPPPLTAEAVVAGIVGVIQARLLQQASEPLVALVNPLMSVIMLPYLGPAAAWEELSRPACESAEPPAPPAPKRDPLEDLDMRLTYRTLRVLAEIAATPGISNQAVAEAAGIRDQGQVSKLLSRVERLGLICNTGAGQPKGRPNAWFVTRRGAEVGRDIGARLHRGPSTSRQGGADA